MNGIFQMVGSRIDLASCPTLLTHARLLYLYCDCIYSDGSNYLQYVSSFVDDYPSDLFDKFLEHMKRCSKAFHAEVLREQRKATLSNLFVICDHTGVSVAFTNNGISFTPVEYSV